MNLYSKIKRELHENPAWNYYGHTVCNPLHSQEDAKKFILDYFEAGSKKRCYLHGMLAVTIKVGCLERYIR